MGTSGRGCCREVKPSLANLLKLFEKVGEYVGKTEPFDLSWTRAFGELSGSW